LTWFKTLKTIGLGGIGMSKKGAYAAVTKARKDGALKVPECCEECGKDADRLDAHHNNYYKRDYLNVTFLCKSCHAKKHPRKKKIFKGKKVLKKRVFKEDKP
jgi:hypothetical protein